MHPEVLDIPRTAQLLALSKSSTYRVVRTGELPAWRLGQQWRLWRPAVLLALAGPDAEEQHPLHPADDPELIDPTTLADLLDIAPQTCLALLRDGAIPSRRVGASIRIWWPSVRQMMIDGSVETHTVAAAH